MKKLIESSKKDTMIVVHLYKLCNEFKLIGEVDTALAYGNRSVEEAKRLSYKRGEGKAYINLGAVYQKLGNYPKALQFNLDALKIGEQIADKKLMAMAYNNAGLVYRRQGNFAKALNFYQTSLKIKTALNDRAGMSSSYNNIGLIQETQNNLDSALFNYLQSKKLAQELNDQESIALSLINIGNVYYTWLKFDTAYAKYIQSLKIMEEITNPDGIAICHINLGNCTYETKKYKDSYLHFNTAIQLSQEIGNRDNLKDAYLSLAKLDSASQNYKSAYLNFKKYLSYRDSLINEESKKNIIESSMLYEFDKKELAAKAEQEKINVISAKEKQNQRIVIYAVLALLLIVVVFARFMYKRYKITEKQKHLIEKQKVMVDEAFGQLHERNKEVIDSIHYAKRIQQAMLTSEEYIKRNFEADYFIYYQPKDIVSGDFYWALKHHDYFYIATADCTGHGVPGAFMSLLNISFLNENVIERNITLPNKILTEQRKEIIKALNPKGDENSKDGMDCVLCAYKISDYKLYFSASNNPLWLLRNGIIVEYKADKMPVGKGEDNAPEFTPYEIELQKGDLVYTFTDGYADQFGGPKGKKFMYKKLENLLMEIHHLPMDIQRDHLKETINSWKENIEQVDDILVIGVKIS